MTSWPVGCATGAEVFVAGSQAVATKINKWLNPAADFTDHKNGKQRCGHYNYSMLHVDRPWKYRTVTGQQGRSPHDTAERKFLTGSTVSLQWERRRLKWQYMIFETKNKRACIQFTFYVLIRDTQQNYTWLILEIVQKCRSIFGFYLYLNFLGKTRIQDQKFKYTWLVAVLTFW